MLIPQDTLQRVIQELQDATGHDIEIMDERGIVVASMDRSRVGRFHAAAALLREQSLAELVISDETAYEGAKSGMILPLMLDGEVAGAVGVHGGQGSLKKVGRIIQKMVQILIADSMYRQQNTLKENMRNHLLFSWLFDQESWQDSQLLMQGYALGIQLPKLRTAVVVDVAVLPEPVQDELAKQHLRETVFAAIRAQAKARMPRSAWLTAGTHLVFLLEEGYSTKNLRDWFSLWKEQMETSHPVIVAVGIGTPVQGQEHLSRSYREADLACRISLRDEEHKVCAYEELLLERLLGNIPDNVKRSFLSDLFHSCTSSEVQQSIQVLKAYYACDGSIMKAAKSLFIHKNTMQYRLNRIGRLTGYDPRKLSDGAVLYFAVAAYEAFEQPPDLGQR